MKKIYTGNINRLTVKNINIFPAAIDKLAFNSVVVEKNALFYLNRLGVPISIDHGTKLLTRYEAEYYIKNYARVNPYSLGQVSCIYADAPFKFSHEINNDEFKKLMKEKKKERKAIQKAKKKGSN